MGNLTTPKRVQKLQMALHAKAKAEADYRFYALYDKISREDILAHAYAQCRSNKGAPGVDAIAEAETPVEGPSELREVSGWFGTGRSRGSAARQVEWLPLVEGEEVRFASDSPRIRTIGSGASGEADAFLPVKDRPR